MDAPARANHGRWIVDCPCGGAERVATGQAWVVCRDIRRSIAGDRPCGTKLRIVWPDEATAVAIVDTLARRPLANQNWEPGETVADLTADNLLHGVTGGGGSD